MGAGHNHRAEPHYVIRNPEPINVGGRTFSDRLALDAVLRWAPKSGDPEAFVATAIIESGINRGSVGDGGHSFGIFQLNDRGRLASYGLTPEQGKDPDTNARVSADEFSKFAGQGKRGVALALAAQRPSDPNYSSKFNAALPIARQLLKQYGGGGTPGADNPPPVSMQEASSGQLTPESLAILEQYLAQTEEAVLTGQDPGDPFGLIDQLTFVTPPPGTAGATGVEPGPAKEGFKAGGGYAGTEGAIKSIAGADTLPAGFSITSAKRPRRNTKSGNVSDHYEGNKTAFAHDIGWNGSRPTAKSDALASRIVSALGGPANWGKSGGNFVTTISGIRFQVIYRSDVGGNHWDHIHVGARRL